MNIFLSNIFFSVDEPEAPFVPTVQFEEVQVNENFTTITAPPAPTNAPTDNDDNEPSSSSSLSFSLIFCVGVLSFILALF